MSRLFTDCVIGRFDVSAVHPANKRVGTYTEISYCKRRTSELVLIHSNDTVFNPTS